ncbi:MAG: DUF3800 domain-containing protein [Methanobacteriaceae archaeon]|jgi:hypothetical protein|nr:DUF3800 domain-containing protein [Candidatus Methanorudis spinitermitis]
MVYLIIDESGDLGRYGSKYFIILGILIKNEKKLGKIIKTLRRNKFKKKLANMHEIKGTNSSSKIIKQILRKLNKLNAKLYCIVFDKEKFPIEDKNKCYDYLAGLIAEQIKINSSLIIRIDKSKAKYEDINKFNKLFIKKLGFDEKFDVEIHHNHSHKHESLQVVDVIAWSFFQKFERENPEFVDLIQLEIAMKKL